MLVILDISLGWPISMKLILEGVGESRFEVIQDMSELVS